MRHFGFPLVLPLVVLGLTSCISKGDTNISNGIRETDALDVRDGSAGGQTEWTEQQTSDRPEVVESDAEASDDEVTEGPSGDEPDPDVPPASSEPAPSSEPEIPEPDPVEPSEQSAPDASTPAEPEPSDSAPSPDPAPSPSTAPTPSPAPSPTSTAPSGSAPTPAPVPAPSPTAPTAPTDGFGNPVMGGSGQSVERDQVADVTRNGQNYFFKANGWPGALVSQTVSWNGTSFTVDSLVSSGPGGPVSHPTVFCGVYGSSSSGECGLPAAIASLQSLRTGWRWEPNGNTGAYGAVYQIVLSSGPAQAPTRSLEVWLRDLLPNQYPVGSVRTSGVVVENVPGSWEIWEGTITGAPIISWTRYSGTPDSLELEFDVLDFIRAAQELGYASAAETYVLGVAVGFQIWSGPVTNLASLDFYVDPQ